MPNSAVRFILVTIFLDAMGFGMLAPVLPHLVAELSGGDAAAGAAAFGTIQAAYAGCLFLFSPLIGRLSDRFGRRPVILVALAGAAVDQVVAALAGSLWLLFAARAVAGLCGGSAATAAAYVADVTPAEKRGTAFAVAGAVFGIGFVSGPAIGGLLGDLGPRVPFWAAAGLTAANFLYGLFVLPESLGRERRKPLDIHALNPFAGLLAWRRSRVVAGLFGAVFLFMLAQSGLQATWVLFTDVALGWGPREVGVSLGALGVVAILAQALVGPKLIGRFGPRPILLAGLGATVLFCLALAFVRADWQLYATLVFVPLAMASGPAAQAVLSTGVEATEQGLLQGTISGVTGLASVFGPPIGAWTFGHFASPGPLHFPGAAFLLAALLALAALGVAARAVSRPGGAARPSVP